MTALSVDSGETGPAGPDNGPTEGLEALDLAANAV